MEKGRYRIISRVISHLKTQPSHMGDDYPNMWCDVILQMQNNFSAHFSLYESYIRGLIFKEIEHLSTKQIRNVWVWLYNTDPLINGEGSILCGFEDWESKYGFRKYQKNSMLPDMMSLADLLCSRILCHADDADLDDEMKKGTRKENRVNV
jgi:hypothetical protein